VRLTFDRGTLLLADLADLPDGLDVAQIPGVLWDERVAAHRAPARLCYPIVSELRRRGVPMADIPRPVLAPPSGFRPFELRPYQEAALTAWRQAGLPAWAQQSLDELIERGEWSELNRFTREGSRCWR